MLRILPILLPILWGIAMVHFSARQTRKRLAAQSTPLDDIRLTPLLRQMAQALDLPRIRVRVYEIAPINGLATADGQIFITRGFLDALDQNRVTAPELAGVIAHELGHVALGHGQRRMRDFAGQNALRVGLTMVFARLIPGLGPWIANGLISLLAAKLSREDEFEADAYATALLIKSGIGATPQITLFEKLSHLAGTTQSAAWLTSHPANADRIAAIENNAANWTA